MQPPTFVRRWGLPFTAVAVIVASVVVLANWNSWVVIPKRRVAVLNALRDPGSAQFAHEKTTRNGYVCGRLNAKNGMGGYTGFQRYASSETDYLMEDAATMSSSRRVPTQELIEGIEWKMQFRKDTGRVPTEQEEFQAAFEKRWAVVCG